MVGDVRGDGYFYAIELVKDKETKEIFDEAESGKLRRGFLSRACSSRAYCRADDPGRPDHPALTAADLRPDPLR